MPAAKPALQPKGSASDVVAAPNVTNIAAGGLRRMTPTPPALSSDLQAVLPPATTRKEAFQPRVPVITGEATYRGTLPVDGTISGQLGASSSALMIRQRPRTGPVESQPELDGELTFKDLLRVNGHVAGRVFSYKGTLIVDTSAKVEAEINVAVCVVSGTVVGDIVAHERVEVGPGATVKGNISTRTLSIKPGAVFQGDCRMLKDQAGAD